MVDWTLVSKGGAFSRWAVFVIFPKSRDFIAICLRSIKPEKWSNNSFRRADLTLEGLLNPMESRKLIKLLETGKDHSCLDFELMCTVSILLRVLEVEQKTMVVNLYCTVHIRYHTNLPSTTFFFPINFAETISQGNAPAGGNSQRFEEYSGVFAKDVSGNAKVGGAYSQFGGI